MGKGRLEAFSDGVIAIIITIMALKVAHGATYNDLLPVLLNLGCYVLSIQVGIYWNKLQYGKYLPVDTARSRLGDA